MENRKTMEKQLERAQDEQLTALTEQKIVVHACSGEISKGYIELSGGVDPAALYDQGVARGTITLRSLGSKTTLDIPLQNVRSLFFVKSFRGDPGRKDIRFYWHGPEVGKLGVE